MQHGIFDVHGGRWRHVVEVTRFISISTARRRMLPSTPNRQTARCHIRLTMPVRVSGRVSSTRFEMTAALIDYIAGANLTTLRYTIYFNWAAACPKIFLKRNYNINLYMILYVHTRLYIITFLVACASTSCPTCAFLEFLVTFRLTKLISAAAHRHPLPRFARNWITDWQLSFNHTRTHFYLYLYLCVCYYIYQYRNGQKLSRNCFQGRSRRRRRLTVEEMHKICCAIQESKSKMPFKKILQLWSFLKYDILIWTLNSHVKWSWLLI